MLTTIFKLNNDIINKLIRCYKLNWYHQVKSPPVSLQLMINYTVKDKDNSFKSITSIHLTEEKLGSKVYNCYLNSVAEYILRAVIAQMYGLKFDKIEHDYSYELKNIQFVENINRAQQGKFRDAQLKFLKCLQYEKIFDQPVSTIKAHDIRFLDMLNSLNYNSQEAILIRTIWRFEFAMHNHKIANKGTVAEITELGYVIQQHIIADYPKQSISELLTLFIKHLKKAHREEEDSYKKTHPNLRFFSTFFCSATAKEYQNILTYLEKLFSYNGLDFASIPAATNKDIISDPWEKRTFRLA